MNNDLIKESIDKKFITLRVELNKFANEIKSFKYWRDDKSFNRDKLLEKFVDRIHFFTSLANYLETCLIIKRKIIYKDANKQLLYILELISKLSRNFNKENLINAFEVYMGIAELFDFSNEEISKCYHSKIKLTSRELQLTIKRDDMNWKELFNKRNHQGIIAIRNKLNELGFKKTFNIFNIVGTNGKGSLSQYLSDSFIGSGLKVGTFTSPHIFKANERIKIDNKEITDKEFSNISKDLDFSFFETLYIVAMKHFQNNNVDIAIIEAGIGGSKDATNAIDGDYGLVSSIGLDHQDILGNTLEEIASNKSGIINKEMKFFIPLSINEELREYFKVGNYKLIDNKGANYKEENIKLARGILKEFNIKAVINKVPYRSEVFKNNGFNAIKDVAHNYDGIKASLKYLKQNNINYDRVVISINKSKWNNKILNLFKTKQLYFYKLNENYYSKGKEIKDLSKEYKKQNKDTLFIGTFRTIEKLK